MSARVAKKLYGDSAAESRDVSDSDSEQDEVPVKKVNPFALLGGDNSESDDEADVELQKAVPPKENETASSKKSKKKKKKKKAAKPPADIDSLLDQLAIEKQEAAAKKPQYLHFFQVGTKKLDYEHEFRELFGDAALRDATPSRSPSPAVPAGWGGRDRRTVPGLSRKLVLTKVRDSFPPAVHRDILMQELPDARGDGTRDYKFVHSARYQESQRVFDEMRQYGDIQALTTRVTALNPYHVPTLLLIADNRTQLGQHGEASEMIEMCLFAYDRALKPGFSFADGTCRLPFRYYENRGFYLVVFNYIKSLMRRGTWATAFEWAKLLWSLDPEEDPYCAGLMIDFFALNAGYASYVINAADEPFFGSGHYAARPNLLYSCVVAHHMKFPEQTDDTAKLLRNAISRFPWVAASLLAEPYPKLDFEILEEQLIYTDLYANQMKVFWDKPELRKLLLIEYDNWQATKDITNVVKPSPGVSLNLVRYSVLSGATHVYKYIGEYLAQPMFADDPFPPHDDINPYRTAPAEDLLESVD